MPAFEQLRIKSAVVGYLKERCGVRAGGSRRATLLQRCCCSCEPLAHNAETFKMPLGAAGLQRYQGAEAWGQNGAEARMTPVLSLVGSCSLQR